MTARGEWEGFRSVLAAYAASPLVYRWDRWLEMWEEVLPGMQKYVLAADRNKFDVRLDWRREASALEGAFQKADEKKSP
jgi:phosphoserine phosphatase